VRDFVVCVTLQEGHVTAAATLWRRHAVLLTGDDADCSIDESSASYSSEQDVRMVAALPEALRCLPTSASVPALAAWLRTEVYSVKKHTTTLQLDRCTLCCDGDMLYKLCCVLA
jgi:hypothetical protein